MREIFAPFIYIEVLELVRNGQAEVSKETKVIKSKHGVKAFIKDFDASAADVSRKFVISNDAGRLARAWRRLRG